VSIPLLKRINPATIETEKYRKVSKVATNPYGNLPKFQNSRKEIFAFGYKNNHQSRKNAATA